MKPNNISRLILTAAVAACASNAPAEDKIDKEKLMKIGQQNFVTCLACHGPDGKGLQTPAGPMAPTFHGSPYINAPDPEIPVAIVLKGIAKEDAKYVGIMAPLGAALDDEKLAAVLTYIRSSYGNSSPPISPTFVAEVREKYKGKTDQWKRGELEKMLEEAKKKAGAKK